jgi:hypothetical protein
VPIRSLAPMHLRCPPFTLIQLYCKGLEWRHVTKATLCVYTAQSAYQHPTLHPFFIISDCSGEVHTCILHISFMC